MNKVGWTAVYDRQTPNSDRQTDYGESQAISLNCQTSQVACAFMQTVRTAKQNVDNQADSTHNYTVRRARPANKLIKQLPM